MVFAFTLAVSYQLCAQTASELSIPDTRWDATAPAHYSKSLKGQFKHSSTLGVPYSGSGYLTLLGLRGWGDNSGGKAHELAFTDDGSVFLRTGLAPSWEGWRKFVLENASGNVGIGTLTPQYPLDVVGKIRVSHSLNTNQGSHHWGNIHWSLTTNDILRFGVGLVNSEAGNNQGADFSIWRYGDNGSYLDNSFFIKRNNGNVGIGTAYPFNLLANQGLHISKGEHSSIVLGDPMGTAGYGGILQTSDNRHRIFIGANIYDDPINSWRNFQSGKGSAGISIIADKGSWGTSIEFYATEGDGFPADMAKMIIKGDGTVGIGTTHTNDAAYRLFVEKGIRTRKVKVDVTSWPDYVFAPTYRLPSLREVEAFIQQYRHLPEVPSAREVTENGLDLGENQAVLLQKIEELTLYAIEAEKKNAALEERLKKLEAKLN